MLADDTLGSENHPLGELADQQPLLHLDFGDLFEGLCQLCLDQVESLMIVGSNLVSRHHLRSNVQVFLDAISKHCRDQLSTTSVAAPSERDPARL